jgi:hypothetical protein
VHDAIARLVDMDFVFGNTGYCIDRKQKVSIPEPEEATRTHFEHPDLPLARVDEEIAYVTDLFIMPIDHLAIADVLIRVGKGEVRFAQLFKFSIRRMLRLAHRIFLPYLGGREIRCTGRSGSVDL